jgi:CBS domain-containing protein
MPDRAPTDQRPQEDGSAAPAAVERAAHGAGRRGPGAGATAEPRAPERPVGAAAAPPSPPEQATPAGESTSQMAEMLRAWLALCGCSPESMAMLRKSGAALAEDMLRANTRLMEEMLRASATPANFAVPQRFASEWGEAMLSGTLAMLRLARGAADDVLRPWQNYLEARGRGDQPHEPGMVGEVMAPASRMASPDDTVLHAAQRMRDEDIGALPVGEGDRLIGMLTDRDVALRLVAEGRDPARTQVREVMTPELRSVFEDASLEDVARMMTEQPLRRLAVLDRQRHVVGVVSLADLMRRRRAAQLQAGAARTASAEAHMTAQ